MREREKVYVCEEVGGCQVEGGEESEHRAVLSW